ncbi:hypothetical protein K2173_019082 [Erythroxylum novogranatense]|uniref:Disease resistance RPP13-like protein 4 n=1 Tax=Erythroxylum novogranatense TaxID=1862640 RepID=A0AAV8STE6_9ROSI|nr:hypothetical protein K2173_019082 [Erythroxylum novogranatense]
MDAQAPTLPPFSIHQMISTISDMLVLLSGLKDSPLHQNEGPNDKGNKTNDVQETCFCCRLSSVVEEKTNVQEDESAAGNNSGKTDELHPVGPLEKLRSDLKYIKSTLENLTKLEKDTGKSITDLRDELDQIVKNPNPEHLPGAVATLRKKVMKLKLQIPSQHSIASRARDSQTRESANPSSENNKLADLEESTFNEFFKIYQGLEDRSKLCLLCFALFPEDVEVKKRLLIYWWVGEGLVESTAEETAEEDAEKVIEELCSKKLKNMGFIVRVRKFGGLKTDSFKMPPLVRSAVIRRAKEVGFFDVDDNGNPTEKRSGCYKVCLVESENALAEDSVRTIFNFNKRFPDYKFVDFTKMKKLNVIYLGRWVNIAKKIAAKHHIEIENTDFLKGLKSMKQLRFISLQGMSRITELPKPMCQLPNLRILDLRACHNLEGLPDEIDLLKKLTHLDVSECYLLDDVPKALSSLTELQVLKGFVVSSVQKKGVSCTLKDLEGLQKLMKLSISTNRKDFPTTDELKAIEKLQKLQKLKIAWGGESLSEEQPVGGTGAKEPSKKWNEVKKRNEIKEETEANRTKKETGPKFPAASSVKNMAKGLSFKKAAKDAKVISSPKKLDTAKTETGGKVGNSPRKLDTVKAETEPKLISSPRKLDAGKVKKSDKVKEEGDIKSGEKPEGGVQDGKLEKTAQKQEGITTPSTSALALKLKKLDLESFPERSPPSWLNPGILKNLKNLYIRGGKLKALGQGEVWEVEILRFKYLSDFGLTWREREASFPRLIYLEKVKCPKLAFYPCDEYGVWMKD